MASGKGNRRRRRGGASSTLARLVLLTVTVAPLLLRLLDATPRASAIEASFTPNPDDEIANGGDGGPLPASTEQRKQLLQLDAVIAKSPNPSETMDAVARQNGMSVEELGGMLDRNRRELTEAGLIEGMMDEANAQVDAAMAAAQQQQGGASRVGNTLPRRLLGVVLSLLTSAMRVASSQVIARPRRCAFLAAAILCAALVARNAPRNGVVISNGSPSSTLFFRGHTTLLNPPVDYLERCAVASWEEGGWVSSLPPERPATNAEEKKRKKKSKSGKDRAASTFGGVGMTRSLTIDDDEGAEEGEVAVTLRVDRTKVDGFALVAAASTLIRARTIGDGGGEGEEGGEGEDDDEVVECMRDSITSMFQERKFSEFVPSSNDGSRRSTRLKFHSFLVASAEEEDDEGGGDYTEGAVLSARLLGDLGRYGVQPLCISYEDDGNEEAAAEDEDRDDDGGGGAMLNYSVAFHTLAGGHFDGEIRFSARETEPGTVAVSVALSIPHGGRAPPVRLAKSMTSSLLRSMDQSARIRTKQAVSRRSQSRRYRARASGRAVEKRHLRYEQERAAEAMAADRKRKWKRNNPDAGHYRPSGHRLKHPHNAGLS